MGQDRNLRKRVGQAKKGGTGPKTRDSSQKKGGTEKGGTGQDSQKKGGTAHVSHPFRVGQGNYGRRSTEGAYPDEFPDQRASVLENSRFYALICTIASSGAPMSSI